MPVTPTYPGVYVQEIPSGVRTITGVATASTAFMGRAPRGPVDEPVTINSFGDYERIFGGLWLDSPMSYAVRDFYVNGGGQAIIVRLFCPSASDRESAQEAAQGVADAAAEAASGTNANVSNVLDAATTQTNAELTKDDPGKTAARAVLNAVTTATGAEHAPPKRQLGGAGCCRKRRPRQQENPPGPAAAGYPTARHLVREILDTRSRKSRQLGQ